MLHETRVAYGEALAELAQENPNIVALDADLSGSTKTALLKKVAPERHINAGIAECNMMGMAAGLAASGKKVFASSFAVFATGRAFEIIRNSICYPHLDVKVCATHAGLSVGEDGASHQAIADLAVMRALPNMQVYSPCDYYETKAIIRHVASINGPCYVRMGRGKVEDVFDENTTFEIGKVRVLNKGSKVCLFATGLMVQEALKVKDMFKAEGLDITVVNVSCLKPLDVEGIKALAKEHDICFALEEHNVIGGLYGALAEVLVQENCTRLYPYGVNDTFGESGSMGDVLNKYGLTAEAVYNKVKEVL